MADAGRVSVMCRIVDRPVRSSVSHSSAKPATALYSATSGSSSSVRKHSSGNAPSSSTMVSRMGVDSSSCSRLAFSAAERLALDSSSKYSCTIGSRFRSVVVRKVPASSAFIARRFAPSANHCFDTWSALWYGVSSSSAPFCSEDVLSGRCTTDSPADATLCSWIASNLLIAE